MDYLAVDIESLARDLQIQRGRIHPLINAVLGAAAGSNQRVDHDMVQLLDSCLAALDGAVGDLHSAARSVRTDLGDSPHLRGAI